MAGRAGTGGKGKAPSPSDDGHDAAEARRLDLNADELGMPVDRLMANAGKALAKELARHAKRGEDVLLLCGKGNNGGDGFAAAAELHAMGRSAWVVLAEPPARITSHAARVHFARLAKPQVSAWSGRPRPAWSKVRVLADCLLGSGLSGPPRPPYAAIVRWLDARRQAGATVVACDVPSGLGTTLALRPTTTVALHRPQAGLSRANAGRVVVAPIGMPARAADIGFGDLAAGYPGVRHDSHKGDNGTVLVVGGSGPLAGAPHYVSLGAYRTGADLVHIATPPAVADLVRCWGPEAIVHAVGGTAGRTAGRPVGRTDDTDHLSRQAIPAIAQLMDRCRALVIGPGLGRHPSTLAATRDLLAEAADRGLPTVVDADGLDALDGDLLARHGRRMVLTPHAREFQDLAGRVATKANIVWYAATHGVTVLRKSAVDVVSDGRRTRECRRGHPTLTVGGTGDVLAGITGALLAKGAAPFEAASAASYLLKSAGEVAASLRSYGATASDVAEAIPSVLARLEAHHAGT